MPVWIGKVQINKIFEQIAKRYDLLNHVLSFGVDIYWRKLIVKKTHLSRGNKVLDLCTGTGDVAIEFAKTGLPQEIVGLDITKSMLDLANKKTAKLSFSDKITFVEGDCFKMPFRDESFDIATIAFGLRNLGDLEKAFSEMARVLRVSGRLVVLEFSMPQNFFWRLVYLPYLSWFIPLIGCILSGAKWPYDYLYQTIKDFPKPDEIEQVMSKLFKNNSKHSLMGGIATLYRGIK